MNLERFERGLTFPEHLERVVRNRELWHGVWERVRLPEDVVAAARAQAGHWHSSRSPRTGAATP